MNPAIDKKMYSDSIKIDDVTRVNKIEVTAGGKGINCARALSNVDAEYKVLTLCGNNDGIFKEMINNEKIKAEYIYINNNIRTNIMVSDGKHEIRINEQGEELCENNINEIIEFSRNIKTGDFVIISGSISGVKNRDLYLKIFEIIQNKGIKLFLDTDYEYIKELMEKEIYLFKPNEKEFERIFSEKPEAKNIYKIISKTKIEICLVTRGEKTSYLYYQNKIYEIEFPKIKTENTLGAGDTLIAVLAAYLQKNEDLFYAIKKAYSFVNLFLKGSIEKSSIGIVENSYPITIKEINV